MERSQSHILMVLLPPQQCILILKVLIWRNKLWKRGSSSFTTGYPINHLREMAVGSGTQSSCSPSLWESPQLMRWERGRLLGAGCFCFSTWASPHFSLKRCHSTLCTSSLFLGLGLGSPTKWSASSLRHGLAFRFKAHGQKPEGSFQLKGQEPPASAAATIEPVKTTKCVTGRGVRPISSGGFPLLVLGRLSGTSLHQSLPPPHLSSSFALHWLLPSCPLRR